MQEQGLKVSFTRSGSSRIYAIETPKQKLLVDCGLTGKAKCANGMIAPFRMWHSRTTNILTILKELGFWLVNTGFPIYANEKHGKHGWKDGKSLSNNRNLQYQNYLPR